MDDRDEGYVGEQRKGFLLRRSAIHAASITHSSAAAAAIETPLHTRDSVTLPTRLVSAQFIDDLQLTIEHFKQFLYS